MPYKRTKYAISINVSNLLLDWWQRQRRLRKWQRRLIYFCEKKPWKQILNFPKHRIMLKHTHKKEAKYG